jgi:hypothetical protein
MRRPHDEPTGTSTRRARRTTMLLTCCWLASTGCSSPPPADPGRRKVTEDTRLEVDRMAVKDPFVEQARRAVLRERVIREMHFVPASRRLTKLGKDNLAILAEALREDGGTIAVDRGSASDALYAARVEEVRGQLVALGIQQDRFSLDGGPAGGQGVPTSAALLIRADIGRTPLPSATGQVLDPRAGTTGAMNGGTP